MGGKSKLEIDLVDQGCLLSIREADAEQAHPRDSIDG